MNALRQSVLEGLNVRCLIKQHAQDAEADFLQTIGGQVFRSDLAQDENILEQAFAQVDIACHLIGSIAPRRGETPELLHIQQTEHFVQHCLKAKVGKVIMVSACGADAEASTDYHRTKWLAEQVIKQSGLPAIILRPSLVIGKTVGNRNSKLIARLEDLIRHKKMVPLIAGGKNKIQPLFIGDLIEAMITCIFSEEADSYENMKVLELGGSEILTLKELTGQMMKKIGIHRSFLDLPPALAIPLAGITEATQEVPILNRDQVKLAQQDNICANNKLLTLIKRNATTIDEALDSYKFGQQ